MKTSIVLQGSEGTGKGMIVQLLAKIVGNIHFFQPSSQDDMFGSFNYMMDNRLLCFADEMFWGVIKRTLVNSKNCSPKSQDVATPNMDLSEDLLI